MRELTQPTSVLRLLLAGPDVGNGLRPNRSGQRAQPTWIRGFESQGGDPMVCRDRLTLEGEPMTFSGWSPNSAGTHLLGAFLPGPCSWAPTSASDTKSVKHTLVLVHRAFANVSGRIVGSSWTPVGTKFEQIHVLAEGPQDERAVDAPHRGRLHWYMGL